MSQEKLNLAPTVTNLTLVKSRLSGAQKGHGLLKKKVSIGGTRFDEGLGRVSTRSLGCRLQADALNVRYRKILREIMEQKQKMGGAMKEAFFSLTEAKYTGGENLKNTIHDNVKSANVRVKAIVENVAGVKIPRFNQQEGDGETNFDMTGLGQGGQQVQVSNKLLPLSN